MEVLFHNVAGLDVHKKTVVVCVRRWQPTGDLLQEVRTFGTMTKHLLEMSEWLQACGVTHVAMESTGVFWKPIWNILEGKFQLLLANPHELKQVPGRKSDVKDSQWIAQLLQYGLLPHSFVPTREQRELRDLTRQRAQLQAERTRVANRIQKVLEDTNIKLSSVASDVLGMSGRDMLEQLLAGERDTGKMAELARGRMRKKIPQLRDALLGNVTDHHRFMLRQLLEHLATLDAQVGQFDQRIARVMAPFVPEEAIRRLDEVPGINLTTIENVVAEIGVQMEQFPTPKQLASWAGLCPGNEESAGKRKRRRTTEGNRWLKRALCQAAWAASHAHDTYFSAQYHRIVARRGKKRAITAVAHSLLVTIYHMLKHGTPFQDLGPDFFNHIHPERMKQYLVSRLETLGYHVTLEPHTAA